MYISCLCEGMNTKYLVSPTEKKTDFYISNIKQKKKYFRLSTDNF